MSRVWISVNIEAVSLSSTPWILWEEAETDTLPHLPLSIWDSPNLL